MEKEPQEEIKMPEELAESLKVLVGERPTSFKEEFVPNTAGYPQFKGTGPFGRTTAQEEFIKKKDPIEKKVRYEKNQIYILDLTDPEDSKKYSDIFKKIIFFILE